MKTYDELVIGLHRPPKTNRSHSFHATSSKHLYSSENNVVISSAEEDSDHEVGMDCERDSLNPSLKDASSLQGYIYIRICSYSFIYLDRKILSIWFAKKKKQAFFVSELLGYRISANSFRTLVRKLLTVFPRIVSSLE